MKMIQIIAAATFTAMTLFIPSITVSATSVGETVSQNTSAELKAVAYENNETIAALLAPSGYSMSDKLNKKTEIARREGKSPADITDEQAVKELNQDNVKIMSFEDSFAEVQANIGEIIQRVVDSTDGAESRGQIFTQIRYCRTRKSYCWDLLISTGYITLIWEGITLKTLSFMSQNRTDTYILTG